MSEKKKGILGKLFKGNGGCNCGVTIIEEKPEKKDDKAVTDTKKGKDK